MISLLISAFLSLRSSQQWWLKLFFSPHIVFNLFYLVQSYLNQKCCIYILFSLYSPSQISPVSLCGSGKIVVISYKII